VAWGQPGPAAQLLRTTEPADVTDLSDEHRGEGRADTTDLLDHPVATVPGETVGDHRPEQLNLSVVGVDQLQQRVDPLPVDQLQRHGAQRHPGGAEQVRGGGQLALLGQRRVHLGLQPAAQGDQLGAVAHQLAQLPLGRGGDVGLGQPAHAQQIGQIRGVAHVVLDPPVGEAFHPQRMRQMNLGTGGLQHVDRPVPAVGRLQHHLRVRAGLGQLQPQRDRVVVDADPAQPLPVLGHPHDHTAPAVQIDPDVLATVVVFVHRGLPQRVVGEHPRASARDHGGRRPRPFIASRGPEHLGRPFGTAGARSRSSGLIP
jgi:hypothetical protein